MTSPDSKDLKLSLFERVSRKLGEQADSMSALPQIEDKLGSPVRDALLNPVGESPDQDVMQCGDSLDNALLDSPSPDENDVPEKLCDMDTYTPAREDAKPVYNNNSSPALTVDDLQLPFDDSPKQKSIVLDTLDYVNNTVRHQKSVDVSHSLTKKQITSVDSISESSTIPKDSLAVKNPTSKDRITENGTACIVEHPGDKHKISLEDLHLPFDDDAPMTESSSPKHIHIPSQPKKARRRRQSADFHIVQSEVILSPDVELPEAPTERRSSRLRRKSTDLYRSRRNSNNETQCEPSTGLFSIVSQAEESIPDTVVNASDNSVNIDVSLGMNEDAVSGGSEDGSVEMLQALQDVHVSTEQQQSMEQSSVVNATNTSMEQSSVVDATNTSMEQSSVEATNTTSMNIDSENSPEDNSKRRRKKRKCNIPTKENSTPTKKAKTSPKKSPTPCLEDIYMNRLWRTEMPTEKTWETIYEEEEQKGKGKGKKKRVLDPDEFYTLTKLKRRRNKAMKQGWKPPTKKKLEKTETLLFEKLSIFEKELDSDQSSMSSFRDCDSGTSIETFGVQDLQISGSGSPNR